MSVRQRMPIPAVSTNTTSIISAIIECGLICTSFQPLDWLLDCLPGCSPRLRRSSLQNKTSSSASGHEPTCLGNCSRSESSAATEFIREATRWSGSTFARPSSCLSRSNSGREPASMRPSRREAFCCSRAATWGRRGESATASERGRLVRAGQGLTLDEGHQEVGSGQEDEEGQHFNSYQLMEEDMRKLIDLQQEQLEAIRAESALEPLVAEARLPLTVLLSDYEHNLPFRNKLLAISQIHTEVCRIRRDGNCFYRGLLLGILERIAGGDQDLRAKLRVKLKEGTAELRKAGFEDFVFEDYQEVLLREVERKQTVAEAKKQLNVVEQSNMMVLFLRFLTSAVIKNNEALYEHYIEGVTVAHFCQTEVEPLDREADQLMVMALLGYLGLKICVVYLDANPALQLLQIPEDVPGAALLNFLYRPGHYDLIY